MIIGRLTKQPRERKRYVVDYSSFLSTGEILSSVPLPTVTPAGGTIQVDTIIIDPVTFDSFSFDVEDGLDGEEYKIEFLAETNLTRIKEDEIIMTVVEI